MHESDDSDDHGVSPDDFILKYWSNELKDEWVELRQQGYPVSPIGFLGRKTPIDEQSNSRANKLEQMRHAWLRKQIESGKAELSGIEDEPTDDGEPNAKATSTAKPIVVDPRNFARHRVSWFRDWMVFELKHPLRFAFDPVKSVTHWELQAVRIRWLELLPTVPGSGEAQQSPQKRPRKASVDLRELDRPIVEKMRLLVCPPAGCGRSPMTPWKAAEVYQDEANWRNNKEKVNSVRTRLWRRYIATYPGDCPEND